MQVTSIQTPGVLLKTLHLYAPVSRLRNRVNLEKRGGCLHGRPHALSFREAVFQSAAHGCLPFGTGKVEG